MRLTVGLRLAGETKSNSTYVQLLEDAVEAGGGGARVVEVGFADYRMFDVAIDLPPPEAASSDKEMLCDLAAADLRAALKDGLGVEPRMLSGRLAVVIDVHPDRVQEAAARLGGLGYRVEVLDGERPG